MWWRVETGQSRQQRARARMVRRSLSVTSTLGSSFMLAPLSGRVVLRRLVAGLRFPGLPGVTNLRRGWGAGREGRSPPVSPITRVRCTVASSASSPPVGPAVGAFVGAGCTVTPPLFVVQPLTWGSAPHDQTVRHPSRSHQATSPPGPDGPPPHGSTECPSTAGQSTGRTPSPAATWPASTPPSPPAG